jgi:RNA polymerase sigma-70 factor (ECF subfamily)
MSLIDKCRILASATMTNPTPPDLDSETQEWLIGLRAGGPHQERTNARLYADLLRVARIEAIGRGLAKGIGGPELEDLAHQAAADSMMVILRKLDEFRGESRFTTWAHRFVALDVTHKVGRHPWRHPTVPLEFEDLTMLSATTDDPQEVADWRALVDVVRDSLDQDLTSRQRSAFVALVVNGVSPGRLAEQTAANRNAVYKMVFDARQKIRTRLTTEGILD